MRASTEMLSRQNLKALNLSHMLRNLEPLMRQTVVKVGHFSVDACIYIHGMGGRRY